MEKEKENLGVTKEQKKTYYADVLRKFRRHRMAMVGLAALGIIILLTILLPLILDLDPYATGRGMPYEKPSSEHLLGLDSVGRDNLARLIYGGRVSMSVGLFSTIISICIGLPLGLCAGYYRGWLEAIVMRLVDIFMSFPSMILIMVIVSLVGPSAVTVTVVIGIMGWPQFARIIYGNVISVRNKEYVEGARSIGAKNSRILKNYILPNSVAPLLIVATFRTAGAVLQEASLSFLGMGVQLPTASWGNILYGAQSIAILSGRAWFWLPPSILLVITVLSINFLGDGLRDALDPKMKI